MPYWRSPSSDPLNTYPQPVLFACVAGYRDIAALQSEYARKREKILSRLEDFRRVGALADKRLFEEMCFCILAVQSKAHGADAAVHDLIAQDLLWPGRQREGAGFLRPRPRFHNHKGAYIVRAPERFFPAN